VPLTPDDDLEWELSVRMPRSWFDFLHRLMAASGDESIADTFRKAMGLYSAAVDECRKGNRLVIVDPEDEIVREIVGLLAPAEDGKD
jgi:hypothetical protein